MLKNQIIISHIPRMMSGKELESALEVLPEYDESICKESASVRLIALSSLYDLFIPSNMAKEIYSKLYLALLRSLQKKETKLAVQQQYENYRAMRQQTYHGIIGGSDSFTIIGTSGIGKSTAIARAISLITKNGILKSDENDYKIIPCLIVQCPFDCSVKGMLLEILRKVDEMLESSYYFNALRAKATTDMLIGCVSQVCLNHIGLLVVDEIQNVVNSKNGKSLIGALTQLINNSGISICMVGTPESSAFFEQAMPIARRSLGLLYTQMYYDDYFKHFCKMLYTYQFVQKSSTISDSIIEWLYEHSAGVIAVVVTLIHDAQEIAILNGAEVLDLTTLNEAYSQRTVLLHSYIAPNITQTKYTKIKKYTSASKVIPEKIKSVSEQSSIAQIIEYARQSKRDVIEILKEHIVVEEVRI